MTNSIIYFYLPYSFAFHIQLNIFVNRKRESERNIPYHEEDASIWEQQRLKSLQDCYLNYYDTIRISITDYKHVSTDQFILTYVIYLLV